MKLNPTKMKYWPLYMDIARLAAERSYCTKLKVGAVVVTEEGMLSIGWNGSPPGHPNVCEKKVVQPDGTTLLKTIPSTIHAEANAIYKMLRTGHSTNECILFTTHAPCINCACLIHNAGIKTVIYLNEFSDSHGLDYLLDSGVKTFPLSEFCLDDFNV